MRQASVLLTCDIHTHSYGSAQVHEDLLEVRRVLRELRLPTTFFFPAVSAELLPGDVHALQEEGHEIGCHGLTHVTEENYARLPASEQRILLSQATERWAAVLSKPPISFRAPAFKVSGTTLALLEELGYRADCSINSQRLNLFGSDLYNLQPLWAPRGPYHPSFENPYTRGATRLWEIPVSAWGVPFASNTERVFGLGFMKCFFRRLHSEAQKIDKPIVFVFHAEDLNGTRQRERLSRLSWKHFLPSRTHGFVFRYFLMELDWRRVQQDLVSLFRFMADFGGVRFRTVGEYVSVALGS